MTTLLKLTVLIQLINAPDPDYLCETDDCNKEFIFNAGQQGTEFTCSAASQCNNLVIYYAGSSMLNIYCTSADACVGINVFCGNWAPQITNAGSGTNCFIRCDSDTKVACKNVFFSCKADPGVIEQCWMGSTGASRNIEASTMECNIGNTDICELSCFGTGCCNYATETCSGPNELLCHSNSHCDCDDGNCGAVIKSTVTYQPTSNPTVIPTTNQPTTYTPTTINPTTSIPSTTQPTTANPTTAIPTTSIPTTFEPTTANPTTSNPTSTPTTYQPTTSQPTTAIPTTSEPTTSIPTTNIPTTSQPTTSAPTTTAPTTSAPTTANPSTYNPTTYTPTTTNEPTAIETDQSKTDYTISFEIDENVNEQDINDIILDSLTAYDNVNIISTTINQGNVEVVIELDGDINEDDIENKIEDGLEDEYGKPIDVDVKNNDSFSNQTENIFQQNFYMLILIIAVGILCIILCILCIIYRKKKKQLRHKANNDVVRLTSTSHIDPADGTHATSSPMSSTEMVATNTGNNIGMTKGEYNDPYSDRNALQMWLNNLELGEYYNLFIQQGFGDKMTALSKLTDQDLEKMGITKMAHRKVILEQIQSNKNYVTDFNNNYEVKQEGYGNTDEVFINNNENEDSMSDDNEDMFMSTDELVETKGNDNGMTNNDVHGTDDEEDEALYQKGTTITTGK